MADSKGSGSGSGSGSDTHKTTQHSTNRQTMTDNMANVKSQYEEALKIAEALYNQSEKMNGAEAEALSKKAQIMSEIAKQQAEILKIAQEIADIEKEITERQKNLSKLTGDELEIEKKKILQLRQKQILHKSSEADAKKAALAQKDAFENLGKTQGTISKLFQLGRSEVVRYIAGVASLSSAISNFKRSLSDVTDVAALSGNYEALQGGMLGALDTARKFQMGAAETRVGLRMLGYQAEEVNAAFNEMTVMGSRLGGALDVEHVARMTAVTGRLAKMLGISLPEAVQHTIHMQQRFGATASQTAQAMIDIQETTDKYNKEAGRMVMNGRDMAKVLMDVAKNSRGAAVEQKYLLGVMQSNIIALQRSGLNYQEALEQSSLYVKKMTSEAPPWATYLAGQELQKQVKLVGGKLPAEMMASLEKARPGLSSRIEKILKETSGVTQRQLLAEALQSTQVGFEAYSKVIDNVLAGMDESQAAQAIAAINNVTIPQAKAMIEQRKMQKEIEADKARLYKMDREAAVRELMSVARVSDKHARFLLEQKNGQELLMKLQGVKSEKELAQLKFKEKQAKIRTGLEVDNLEKQKKNAIKAGDTGLVKEIEDKIARLDEKKGTETQEKTMEEKLAAIQGGETWKALDMFWEKYLGSPISKMAIGIALLAGAQSIQALPQLAKGMGAVKDFVLKRGGVGGILKSLKTMRLPKRASAVRASGYMAKTEAAIARSASSAAGAASKAKYLTRFAKGAKVLGYAGTAASIAAEGYGAYEAYQQAETGEGKKKVLATKGAGVAGGVAGGVGGAWAGGWAGATIGTMVLPGVGTAIGGLIGSGLGAVLGGEGGKRIAEKAGDAIYDATKENAVTNAQAAGVETQADVAARTGAAGAGAAGAGAGAAGLINQPPISIQVGEGGEARVLHNGQSVDVELTFPKVVLPIGRAYQGNRELESRSAGNPLGR